MKVLVSNDDGPPCLASPFILPFIEHLESLGWDVKVCLPDGQKSWISKSFMITAQVQLRYFNRTTHQICNEKENDNDFILLSGTPATCVNIALNHLYKDEEFDLVIGGPNYGNNLANLYTLASGTVGVAMEAVLNKQKAVAVSFGFLDQRPECIKNCCEIATDVIEHVYNKGVPWPEHGLFNINIPMIDYKCPIHLTEFHKGTYGSLFEKQKTRKGEPITFKFEPDLEPLEEDKPGLPGTDKWAIANNCVSVTPLIAAFQTALSSVNDIDYNFDSINEKYSAK